MAWHGGDVGFLALEVLGWENTEFPGWLRVRLLDAAGRSWFFVDKVPVLLSRLDVEPGGALPHTVEVACEVVESARAGAGAEETVTVSTYRSGVWAQDGTYEFVVHPGQLGDSSTGQ